MTYRECAIVEAYTGICMLSEDKSSYFYKYVEDLLGRPIWTHELANERIQKAIQNKSKPDFIQLCATATED